MEKSCGSTLGTAEVDAAIDVVDSAEVDGANDVVGTAEVDEVVELLDVPVDSGAVLSLPHAVVVNNDAAINSTSGPRSTRL